jgi:hypothetical protein
MLSSPFNHHVLSSPNPGPWTGPSPLSFIVRVPELTYSNVAPVLDAGAQVSFFLLLNSFVIFQLFLPFCFSAF